MNFEEIAKKIEKDYGNGLKSFQSMPENIPPKLIEYGKNNLYGIGCPKNEIEAFKFFSLAEALGGKEAVPMLAKCYFYGYGCKKNLQRAVEYYRRGYEEYGDESCYEELKKLNKVHLTSATNNINQSKTPATQTTKNESNERLAWTAKNYHGQPEEEHKRHFL